MPATESARSARGRGPCRQRWRRADHSAYAGSVGQILLDPPISEPEDIANAVLFLASDESRTITGTQLTVDHGATKV
jgi:NAD(P)-dependent dehydrogenase (short-subunit alcohol dehydrogenase family)